MSHKTFHLGDLPLSGGEVLYDARLVYQTYGAMSPAGDNVVVMPTFYTGSHERNEGFFGPGRALDPARHFIVSINLIGGGKSSSPSNSTKQPGATFPAISFQDNVRAQYILLTRELAMQNHYPAVDVLGSISRVMDDIVDDGHRQNAYRLKQVMATYRKAEDLINIGAYVSGSNPKIDYAITMVDKINAYLQQYITETVAFDDSVGQMEQLFESSTTKNI